MRKTLAASAIGATLVLGGPALAAQAAPSDSPSPVATATQTATATDTATATATASSTEQVQTTVTKKESDKTGLWGLLGLAGLAGLIPRKRHEPVHHVERTTTNTTTVAPARHTEARRVDHVDNPVRTTEVGRDADDVRVRTTDEVRNTTNDRRNI